MTTQIFEAPEVLRAITNVNGFVPARSRYPVVRYELSPGLSVTAADLYVIATDYAEESVGETAHGAPSEIILASDDSKAVEKFIRGAKRARVELSILASHPALLKVENLDNEEDEYWVESVDEVDSAKWPRWFENVDGLMAPLERRTEAEMLLPDAIAFATSRLASFAKVRTADTSADTTVMDLRIYDVGSPVHVKIGASFRGAIQPITREAAEEGALWNE